MVGTEIDLRDVVIDEKAGKKPRIFAQATFGAEAETGKELRESSSL